MGEPGGLPSMGSHRVGHDLGDLAAAAAAACCWVFTSEAIKFSRELGRKQFGCSDIGVLTRLCCLEMPPQVSESPYKFVSISGL